MGRSKFPGKPTKYVNRTRINVLSPVDESFTESTSTLSSAIENNERKQVRYRNSNENDVPSLGTLKMRRRHWRKLKGSNMVANGTNKKGFISRRAVKSRICLASGKTTYYSTIKTFKHRRLAVKESSAMVGNFVLPTRSSHSSRVIKPNKRFVNLDMAETTLRRKKVNELRIRQTGDYFMNEAANRPRTKTVQNGHALLRQARLKLHNQTARSLGPFSSNIENGCLPGTATCGVCGAVHFYRFIKQARKFNIFSCESCRKFISKMIKLQSCHHTSGLTIVCHKGQGMCDMLPITRLSRKNQSLNAYKSRCPACWLKTCLLSFQMPLQLKHKLIQLLPANMQRDDILFKTNPMNQESYTSDAKQNEMIPAQDSLKTSGQISNVEKQKLDLKGPRVKHVCRSASIVLGQTPATFSSDLLEKKTLQVPVETEKPDRFSETNSSGSEKTSDSETLFNIRCPNEKIVPMRRERSQKLFNSSSSLNECKGNDVEINPNDISIDYCKKYSIDDVNENGFMVCTSQRFSMPAICFLCGSAGREELLFCTLCCEPYHPYCLKQTPPIVNGSSERFMWLCPRCSTCGACKKSNRQKILCTKCSKAYHIECFTDRPLNEMTTFNICNQCLTCTDCGKSISRLVGNIFLCDTCFIQRKSNLQCNICQHQFDKSDDSEKIMECSSCSKWVHPECQGLSDDYYHILIDLPESAAFCCTSCLNEKTPRWMQAIESELLRSFNRIVCSIGSNNLSRYSTNERRLQPELVPAVELLKNDINALSTERRPTIISMEDIKDKLNTGKYHSITEFDRDMEITLCKFKDHLNVYRILLKLVFPFFRQCGLVQNSNSDLNVALESKNLVDEPSSECSTNDSRSCAFCGSLGDGIWNTQARLLYCGVNKWVHANCALWSSGVSEENGSLRNVQSVLARSRSVRCSHCKLKGGTVSCSLKTCFETYHFKCAVVTNCHFLKNKAVYCHDHEIPSEFNIVEPAPDLRSKRTLFVATDDNVRYSAPVDKINVMVGSLHVCTLGEINPLVSDHPGAIVPTGYLCSRLYWSTVEPWRMVSYKISTSIYNSCPTTNVSRNKNFTVDHTLPKRIVEKKMRDILLWHKKLDKNNSGVFDFEDESESQGSTEILSPEITDAILNEFPHDLLNDISVQDIITKLMSYDDSGGTDCLYDVDVLNYMKVNRSPKINKQPIVEYFVESDQDDDNRKVAKTCGFTVLGNTHFNASPVKKKRKLEKRDGNVFLKVLQVDGAMDDSSSSDCDSSNECDLLESDQPVTCVRCDCTYRTGASYKRHLNFCEAITSESDSETTQEHDDQHKTLDAFGNQFPNLSENVSSPQLVVVSDSMQSSNVNECISSTSLLTNEVNDQFFTMNGNNLTCSASQTGTLCFNQTIGYQRTAAMVQPGVIMNQNETIPTLLEMPAPMNSQPLMIAPTTVNYTIPDVGLSNSNCIYPVMTQLPTTSCIETVGKPTMTINKLNLLDKTVPKVQESHPSNPVIFLQMPSNNLMPILGGSTIQSINNQYVALPVSQPYYQLDSGYKVCNVMPEQQTTILSGLENRIENNVASQYGLQLVQPFCYGVQTVVQNTVMQSQQLVPSALPGLLTANRTTTQIFQTSKIEPLLEVPSNLVVSNDLFNTQLQSFGVMNNIQTNQCETVKNQELLNYTYLNTNSLMTVSQKPSPNLPPVMPEQVVPTKVATPKPKVSQTRPMNRVLPMLTMKRETKVAETKPVLDIVSKEICKEKLIKSAETPFVETKPIEKPIVIEQRLESNFIDDNISPVISENVEKHHNEMIESDVAEDKKPEQIAISKKIMNTFNKSAAKYNPTFNIFNSKRPPVQVAPLKPIKSTSVSPLSEKKNQLTVLKNKTSTNINSMQKFRNEKKENENVTSILYTIETHDGFKFSSTSVSDLWVKVFEAVQSARLAHNMPLLPSDSPNFMDAFDMLGLKKTGLRYLIEQLPDAAKCTKYQPLFSFPPKFIETEPEDIGSPNGCARCEPHVKRHSPYDMFGWLASKHRRPEQNLLYSEFLSRRGSVTNLPMAMRFRQLKMTSKFSVGVYRSDIHRRGLFCLRDFEAGEMVIEYSGEVIRSVLTDKREKFYNTKGIGCYMFRIDDNLVVDATMTGNAARFINHSCDPNCYSKVVEILGHKHIIIFALRKIICGEELTYDYKFPIEEDKIPCTCGARRCRKFLN